MSQKLDKFYIDGQGNFRAILQVLSPFEVDAKDVYYDPEKAKIIVNSPSLGKSEEFLVGEPEWNNDDILRELEKNNPKNKG